MRLIDSDSALEQIEIRKRWNPKNGICVKNKNGDECAPVDSLIKFLENRPTVDAVPVVRCKDCIHYDGCMCENGKIPMNKDDFCSYGERREQG